MRRVIIAFLLVAMAAPALAQPSVSPEEKKRAEEFFRAGERAFNAKEYLVAAQALEEALKIYPVAPIIFSTAQAYRLQYFVDKDPGWLKRSIELYRMYVADVKKGGRRGDAVESLAELEPLLARLEQSSRAPIETRKLSVESTQLMISTNVEGAKTTIDGQAGSLKQVEPGEHVVRAEAPGYFPIEEKRMAVEGRLVIAELMLKPMPATVRVKTEGGARVEVNGRSRPERTGEAMELEAGKYFIAVTRRGRYAWMREITVKRGQKVDLTAPLRTTTQRKVAWGVLGAAQVTFGIAGFTGFQAISANGKASDLFDKLNNGGLTVEELDEYDRQRARRDDKVDQTLLFAGVGTAIAATGVLMMLFDNPTAEAPMSSGPVAPVALRDGAGVMVSGRF